MFFISVYMKSFKLSLFFFNQNNTSKEKALSFYCSALECLKHTYTHTKCHSHCVCKCVKLLSSLQAIFCISPLCVYVCVCVP